MDIAVVALILSFVLGLFVIIIIPQIRKSDAGKGVNSKATGKVSNTYTNDEVALHDKRTDCWIIIKQKVYDVTTYVETHPGGDAILTNAGGDATKGFYGPQHASLVYDLVEEFYIGELKN